MSKIVKNENKDNINNLTTKEKLNYALEELGDLQVYVFENFRVSKEMKIVLNYISDMIEKPKPEEVISNFSILGRCVLPAKIFDILETIPTGAGGEYQLTDAMKVLAQTEGMIGVDFTGTRYDMGNKLGIMKACVEVALKHPEIGEDFREYLKTLDI